jgi:ABC-type polysaccharide/polyol phosphate export permease
VTALILLIIILAFPLFLGLFFRVSSSHIFFSLMAGELLARYFGHDLEQIIKSFTLNQNVASYSEIIIVTVPMIATAFILRGTMKKRRMLLQLVPLAITGIVFAAFILPILPESAQNLASQEQLGKYLLELDSAVIAIVVCAQLLALWVQNRLSHAKKEGKK